MHMSLRASAGAMLAGTALLLFPPAARGQTDGFVLHCLSARAAGLGCVTRGQEGIPTTLFHDPAGIVSFDRPAFEANLTAFVPALSFRNSANAGGAKGALHGYPMGSLAYVGRKLVGSRLAWAVGMEPIGGFGSDFRLTNPVLGPAQSYESFFAALKVGPTLAWQLAPGLSVGASASLVYGQVRDFRMPFSMPATSAAGLGAMAQMDPHYAALYAGMPELTAYGDSKSFAGTGFTGDLGISWKVSPRLRLSASWSPKSALNLSGGSATIDMSKQFQAMFGALVAERMQYHGETADQAQASVMQLLTGAGLNLSLGTAGRYDAALDMTLPQTVGIGGTWKPASGWTLALEGGWMGWKSAEYDMPFKLTNSSNPNLNILINADPTNGSFTYLFPLRWQNSWVAKLGAERDFGPAALRAGYAYGKNPVPANAVFITFPAIVEHSAMVGGTVRLGGFPLDLAVAHAFDKRLDGTSPSLIGTEYQGSQTDLQETVVTVGTVLHF